MTAAILARGGAVVLLGELPALATYLARLVTQRTLVEFASVVSERVFAIVREYPATPIILGSGFVATTKEVVRLRELQSMGANVLASERTAATLRDLVSDHLLPWDDQAWFTPETYRTFARTARSRVQFARLRIESVNTDARSWLAEALMVCPTKMDAAARVFGISRSALERRMLPYGETWHALGDRLVLHVCAQHAPSGDVKEGAVSPELGCTTVAELSRRLRRLGTSWRDLAARDVVARTMRLGADEPESRH